MKSTARLASRLVLAAAFCLAGGMKLTAPQHTLAAVHAYHLPLPAAAVEWIAAALPWMEVLLGLALASGRTLPAALGWTTTFLGGFTLLTTYAWLRGLPIDCGCLGLSRLHPGWAAAETPGRAALRDVVLLALSIILMKWEIPSAKGSAQDREEQP